MVAVKGCHLVGSVPLADSESVFRQCCQGLPHRLRRVPDGETGIRNWFTFWQSTQVFSQSPMLRLEFVNNEAPKIRDFTPAELQEGIESLKAARPLKTGYDEVAVASYQVLKGLRDQGIVDKDVKFLASIPTSANVLAPFIQPAFQSAVEPIYEEALFQSMRRLQDSIPHHDLSIQIDLAVDTMFWEGLDMYKPWWKGDVKSYIVDYVVRMLEQVDPDVEVGLHNCYGDMEHRHWLEPTSLAVIVERGTRIVQKSRHPLAFFHFPVPLSAIDNLEAYYAPLEPFLPLLAEHKTEIIIGCVHHGNQAATQKMIDAARRVPGMYDFSVSTECGMGRTPPEQLEDILRLSTEVSEPIS